MTPRHFGLRRQPEFTFRRPVGEVAELGGSKVRRGDGAILRGVHLTGDVRSDRYDGRIRGVAQERVFDSAPVEMVVILVVCGLEGHGLARRSGVFAVGIFPLLGGNSPVGLEPFVRASFYMLEISERPVDAGNENGAFDRLLGW